MKLHQYKKLFGDVLREHLVEGNSKEDLADQLIDKFSLTDWKQFIKHLDELEQEERRAQ